MVDDINPALHPVQDAEPKAENVPALHTLHELALEAPTTDDQVPAAQLRQELDRTRE